MTTATKDTRHEPTGALVVPPGLKGVVVSETSIGGVRGAEGFYHYRQYAAPELAETRSLEDVWQLLIDGALPQSEAEQRTFSEEVRPLRRLPALVAEVLPTLAGSAASPSGALRTAVSQLAAATDLTPTHGASPERLRADALRLSAAVPTLVAAIHRLRNGASPVAPRDDLSYVANYLWMVTGETPRQEAVRGIEQYMILALDHGFNASTFTARVVTSTGADLGAAVVAALGALSGPLHGGAPSLVLDTLERIGHQKDAAAWVRGAIQRGERIMGFGHPVYRVADPRSVMLRSIAERLGGELVDLAVTVEREVERTLSELKPDRPLHTNVEYYAAVVMDRCGLPRELFTPTFSASRVIGWCAHALEQAEERRIIRPSAAYVGPTPPVPVPSITSRQ